MEFEGSELTLTIIESVAAKGNEPSLMTPYDCFQREIRDILKSLKPIVDVLMLLLFIMFMFALLGKSNTITNL